jgi:LDH2 family malate/lactate/ureidoglycolate dehydrogenase
MASPALPGYLDRGPARTDQRQAALKAERVTPVAATARRPECFRFVVGMCAINEAMAMARRVRHRRRVGAAQHAISAWRRLTRLPAIEAGLHGDGVLQTLAAMPPWGGKDGLLGTNPFCVGAPGGKLAVPASTCRRGRRRGQDPARGAGAARRSPLGYALDSEGPARPPIPTAALGGVVLPIGTYKGSGISMMMDILRRRDLGAAFAGPCRRPVQGLRPAAGRRALLPGDEAEPVHSGRDYRARMDTLVERVRACRRRKASTKS